MCLISIGQHLLHASATSPSGHNWSPTLYVVLGRELKSQTDQLGPPTANQSGCQVGLGTLCRHKFESFQLEHKRNSKIFRHNDSTNVIMVQTFTPISV